MTFFLQFHKMLLVERTISFISLCCHAPYHISYMPDINSLPSFRLFITTNSNNYEVVRQGSLLHRPSAGEMACSLINLRVVQVRR